MPRFFAHLRGNVEELVDCDGVELPVEQVAGFALRCARDVIAGDVLDGSVDLNYRIDVEDAEGTVVYSLSFTEAVHFVSPR